MSPAAHLPRVAYQGEPGAFSEEAAQRLLGPEAVFLPRPTFESLFAAEREGAADFVLAPMENTLAGSVHRSYDLLLESGLAVSAEVVLPIRLCLIGLPGARLEEITCVESHPVALAQCEGFFRAHPRIRRLAADDTAGSVRAVVALGNPAHAAIAGKRAADIYGGAVLHEDLQDHRENYTRFFLLSRAPQPPPGANKLSLVLRLAHRPGALCGALAVFARAGINLLKIESRPLAGRPWQYVFYLDLQVPQRHPGMGRALEELRAAAEDVRVLGWYVADGQWSAPVDGRAKEAAHG
jgi:prephenate dehydratase